MGTLSRLVSSLPVAIRRLGEVRAGTSPTLRSYIKKHQDPFAPSLCYRAIITQAAGCDLCPRFFFLALFSLSSSGEILLLGVWFAACRFKRFKELF